MKDVKELLDLAQKAKALFVEQTGQQPLVVTISWSTYEILEADKSFPIRSLCGTALRVDPFCPNDIILFQGDISGV